MSHLEKTIRRDHYAVIVRQPIPDARLVVYVQIFDPVGHPLGSPCPDAGHSYATQEEAIVAGDSMGRQMTAGAT